MSRRQPTIEINDRIIAHDEIISVIDLRDSAADKQKTSNTNAVKLVDGTILPLPPQQIRSIINFLYQNEQ